MKTNLLKPDSRGRFLIPLQEAAAMLSMDRVTLYRKIRQGLFPEPLKQGNRSFYALTDVETYLGNLKRKN